MKRKNILIFFPEGNLPYSPSTINLYDELSAFHNVQILSRLHNSNEKVNNRIIEYLPRSYGRIYWIYYHFYKLLRKKGSQLNSLEAFCLFSSLKRYVKRHKIDDIIAVDLKATAISQLVSNRVHFLSFELTDLTFLGHVNINSLASVLIQSMERYDYLFNVPHKSVFVLPNSPVFDPSIRQRKVPRNSLIFSGYASKGFGVYACVHFLKKFPERKMVIRGALEVGFLESLIMFFPELLDESRLLIDTTYQDDKDMLGYLTQFKVGFAFYDFRLSKIDNFNYWTAPSGKLYKYLAAGVPVIGINIPGFSIVQHYKAGVLIDTLDPDSIQQALDIIEADYESYVENAFRAAESVSFDRAVKPFIDFIS
jgi:glycosyltransferase involved in cell wall biosynthesis